MRRLLGYALIALAGLFGALGLVFALFAGGNEGDALRVNGLVISRSQRWSGRQAR